MQISDFWARINSLYGFQTSPVDLCKKNIAISTRIDSLYRSQTSPVDLCKKNMVICTRINGLYGSQTSPVDLSTQNIVISTRNTSLDGSQTSPVDMCMLTACLPPELIVSMGPRPHQSICANKTACLAPNYKSLRDLDLNCGFVNAKQRLYDQNY